MKKILLKRVKHHDVNRIALIFDYDPALISIARNIKSFRYSSTKQFWHVEDSEVTLRCLIKVFRDIAELDISGICLSRPDVGPDQDKIEASPVIPDKPLTSVQQYDDSHDDCQTCESKSLKPATTTITKIYPDKRPHSSFGPVEFRVNDNDSLLTIKFRGKYDKRWINELKSYGKIYYDKTRMEFHLRWSKLTVDSLVDYFSGEGVEVRVIRPLLNEVIKESRKNFGDEVRSRELSAAGTEALEVLRRHLDENRYSKRTNETYLPLLELFFKYFNEKNPDEITQNDVSDLINEFIIKNGFSSSYQNQMISSIKMYYELSGKGKIIPQMLERPRRGRALPKVFSKEEVSRILNATRNSKHKLLLWLIYSCGLRRSEVTNLRIEDIDRSRNIIHIQEGKGGVDRIVPVSEKVWKKLDEYLAGYMPRKYLFEGQSGGRYSVESVYNVFKQALKKAGIKKEVGVHSLRHSYATHLHESGLDIRYIQELLGHKSTRTTEIYTHVSRRNLVAVRSPIEDLDVK